MQVFKDDLEITVTGVDSSDFPDKPSGGGGQSTGALDDFMVNISCPWYAKANGTFVPAAVGQEQMGEGLAFIHNTLIGNFFCLLFFDYLDNMTKHKSQMDWQLPDI